MTKRPSFTRQSFIPFLITVALISGRVSSGQDAATQLPQAIQQYLDSGTSVVGWIDISQINLDDFVRFRERLNGAEVNIESLGAVRDALTNRGVTRIYWLSNLSGLLYGPQAVVVPIESGQKDVLSLVQTLILPDQTDNAKAAEGAVLVGKQKAIDELLSPRVGKADDALLSAVSRVTDPHGLVIVPSVQSIQLLKDLLPNSGNAHQDRVAQLAEQLVSVKAITLSGKLPPTQAALRISMSSAQTAESFSSLLNEWLTDVFPDRPLPIFSGADDTEVMLRAESINDALAVFEATQRLATGNSRPESVNALQQIAIAIHSFHNVYGRFPPQSLSDENGRRLLSWRVLILPFLGHDTLYQEFRLDEPWDSEHNLKLVNRMPKVFRTGLLTDARRASGKTRFVAPLTENSVFGRPGPGVQIREITDGTSNTLMIVEADADRAVIWTKPEDSEINTDDPLASIIGGEAPGFVAAFCDGSRRFLSRSLDPAVLRALLTINGGEIVDARLE